MEDFYLSIIRGVPSIDVEFDEVKFGQMVAGGLTRSDIYIPMWDLVIEFDGPCHYFQKRNASEVTANPSSSDDQLETQFSMMDDLTPYMCPATKLLDRIVKKHHKRSVRFDF